MMKFSDGMTFDTSGSPRIVSKSDGLYVVGNNMLIPIDTREEGMAIIKDMNKRNNK